PQERTPLPFEMLPGVFAVKDDENGCLSPAGSRGVPRPGVHQSLHEVVRSGICRPRRVVEPDCIRQRVVSKTAVHLLPVAPDTIRAIERLWIFDLSIADPRQRA